MENSATGAGGRFLCANGRGPPTKMLGGDGLCSNFVKLESIFFPTPRLAAS
ncbi:hypothetical protein CCACVL1_12450 [Corchorus capsularis]|uniref:Uncharacterized protein n=1 Tax=Corchorus capsularis TaxID=210143 RepID=A0A1R3IFN9_COCAP|nr:hypothetical protein CCACVL1_12450 [Corchorus capsularis]